jgi:4-amino-4-deoxy-L-arabinose transferase-like glycosyltransferase
VLSNSKSHQTSQPSYYTDLLYLIVLMGIFYALWIGAHALFIPDEGRYSEVAREMVASGDYITPRLNGVAFLDKPALYYWLQASAIHLFGLKEWSLRFWPALMGVFGTLITYVAGRFLWTRRAGLLSAVMLGTTSLYYGAAHYANLDLEVAVLISSSLLCFLAGLQAQHQPARFRFLISAYVFSGLAFLTKGLIGIAFPGLIVGVWILLLNRWANLKNMYLMLGIIIFLAITAPWYILVQKANPEFLHFFFVTQQVSRFLTTQDFNSKAAFWFYIPVVLIGFFPWSLFLVQAFIKNVKQVFSNKQLYASELFLVIWFSVVFIFFSIPKSKTVGYILPVFPAAALLVGVYIDYYWTSSYLKKLLTTASVYVVLSLLLGVAFLLAPFAASFLEAPAHLYILLREMSMVLFASALAVALSIRKQSMKAVFLSLTLTIGSLLLLFIANADGLNEKSIKPLAVELRAKLTQQDEVITYYKYYQDLPIYLERRITIVADWHAADIANNDNWLREMWYGMVFQDTKDWLIDKPMFWKRWHSDKRLFVITDTRYFDNFKNQPGVYVFSKRDNVVIFSNKEV